MKTTLLKFTVDVEVCSDKITKDELKRAFGDLGAGRLELEEQVCSAFSHHILSSPHITADDIDSVGSSIYLRIIS